ncbi:unnamed protein product [Prunus armeniaca]|uniref:Uncharacterized protein n=1 Tax=Prunus armeniaca TaxID=36596 RepID=A0A6J5X3W5_PRUAR|nr:unnamed protein product [Prunus armeniaca]
MGVWAFWEPRPMRRGHRFGDTVAAFLSEDEGQVEEEAHEEVEEEASKDETEIKGLYVFHASDRSYGDAA